MKNNYDISMQNKNNVVVHVHERTNKSEIINELCTRCSERVIEYLQKYIYGDTVSYSFQIIILDDEIIINKVMKDFTEVNRITFDKIQIIKVKNDNRLIKYMEFSRIENKLITENDNNKDNTILDILNDLSNRISNCSSIVNYSSLIRLMRLINRDEITVIGEDNDIMLTIYNFRDIRPTGMQMNIVLKETNQIIGTLEFTISSYLDENFTYEGNVSYEIYPEFRNLGYATKAVKILKEYISNLSDEYNKKLYIATLPENIASQKVAEKCGGELCYEGETPANSKAKIYCKADNVKIYKIANN